MGVNIFDPNSKIGNGIENGEPRYEKFIPYVEFYGIRYNDVEYLITSTGTTYTQGKDNKLVNFLGFDTIQNLYTTRATDSVDGETDTVFKDEGFGITDIDIDIKSKFVPKVTINFTDIKGSSLFNRRIDPETKEMVRGDYSILFDFPPPTFVLVIKGVFGKAVRMVLHILNYKVSYDSGSGNFNVVCDFVGKSFAPLTDIKLGWLKAAPFIDNNNKTIITDERSGIDSFYELILKGDKLYDKINVLVNSSVEKTKISSNNNLLTKSEELRNEVLGVHLDSNKYVKDGTIKGIAKTPIDGVSFTVTDNGSIQVNNGVAGDKVNPEFTNKNCLVAKLAKQPTSEVIKIITAFTKQKKKLLDDPTYREILGTNNVTDNDINIYQKIDPQNDSGVIIYFDYTTYEKKLIDGVNKIITEQNVLNSDLQSKVNTVVHDQLGYSPTVRNIFKTICDDIDIFFNLIKNAGDHNRKENNEGDLKTTKSGGFPRVTLIKQESIKQRDGSTISVNRETAVYPGSKEIIKINPEFKNWSEVQFVEKFITAYFKIKQQEEFQEEIEKLAEDGTKRFIPSNPIEIDKFGDSKSIKYLNKNTDDEVLLTFFKRYMIQTQYTYKGYWGESYFEERRKSLVEFLAQSEVENLVNSVFDEDVINMLIQLFGNEKVFTKTNFLTSVDNYFTKNPQASQRLPQTKKFLTEIDNEKELKISSTQNIYSYRDVIDYEGIRQITDFNESSDVVDSTNISSSERPTKYLFDYINGNVFQQFFQDDSDKPNLTNDNIIFFKDVKSIEDDGDSDFYKLVLYEILHKNFKNSLNNDNKITEERVKEILIGFLDSDGITYDFDHNEVYDKFSYPAIIALPKYELIYIGNKINKGKHSYLAAKDKKVILKFYNDYINSINVFAKEISNLFTSKTEEKDLKNYNFYRNINEKIYLMNFTSFTFLDESIGQSIIDKDLNLFYPILQKDSNGKIKDDTLAFDTTGDGSANENKRGDVYYSTFVGNLIPKLKTKLEQRKKVTDDILSKLNDDNLKSQLYYDFKKIYDRWIKGTEETPNTDFAYPYSNNTSLISKFNFIDRASNDIGDQCIIDFSTLLEYGKISDSEVYGTMGALLAKNNFEFFPMQNFIDFASDPDAWQEIFNTEETALVSSSPLFNCMYVGGFSTEDSDDVSFNKDKPSLNVSDIDSNAFCFDVKIGIQNQTIFKDITLNTTENKETNESLKLMDSIFTNLGQNQTPTPKGQNMLDMYENRAYSCEVSIPLGNMLIQPLQYFELYYIPIYKGVYIILEVKHKMSSSNNKLTTTFKGSKISRWMKPIITDAFVDITNVSSDLTQLSQKAKSTNNLNNTNTANTVDVKDINDQEILVRSDGGSKLIIRDNITAFINDSRNLTFKTTTIDRSKVTITRFNQKYVP